MRLTSKNGWCSPIDSDMINAMYKKLAAYEDAEEQGRLVILPEMLYEVNTTPLIKGVTEWKVTGALYYDGTVQSYTVQTKKVRAIISGCEIGKSAFLSREEAEAVLEKGK